ncbi:MAG TPA: hypothetical protein VFB84_21365 [Micromonosporaceae bacterium]|nr:hypothetical protein [Micromonosporaceae bacterium]
MTGPVYVWPDHGPASPDTIRWAAQQVTRMHDEPPDPHRATGRCAQCGADRCRLLAWARQTLAVTPAPHAWRAGRGDGAHVPPARS